MPRTRYRYTGAGFAYYLAGVLGGAIPILVANEILSAWGTFGVGAYLAALAALSFGCLLALPETRDVDIDVPAARSRELVRTT